MRPFARIRWSDSHRDAGISIRTIGKGECYTCCACEKLVNTFELNRITRRKLRAPGKPSGNSSPPLNCEPWNIVLFWSECRKARGLSIGLVRLKADLRHHPRILGFWSDHLCWKAGRNSDAQITLLDLFVKRRLGHQGKIEPGKASDSLNMGKTVF